MDLEDSCSPAYSGIAVGMRPLRSKERRPALIARTNERGRELIHVGCFFSPIRTELVVLRPTNNSCVPVPPMFHVTLPQATVVTINSVVTAVGGAGTAVAPASELGSGMCYFGNGSVLYDWTGVL